MLFSAIDAKAFFGKKLGTKLMARCQVNLTKVVEHKRSDHFSTIVAIKHYSTTEFMLYVINRQRDNINGTNRNMNISKEFYIDAVTDMCEFGAYLSTVEALKDINPTPTIHKVK